MSFAAASRLKQFYIGVFGRKLVNNLRGAIAAAIIHYQNFGFKILSLHKFDNVRQGLRQPGFFVVSWNNYRKKAVLAVDSDLLHHTYCAFHKKHRMIHASPTFGKIV